MKWSDGAPVTAHDFEWSWKRNLRISPYGYQLDVVAGAADYRVGEHDDPDRVKVTALDERTLEVGLTQPVNYFLYLTALHTTMPLRRDIVERYGEDWWRPEHIVTNGVFRLERFDDEGGFISRNPSYPPFHSGNLDGMQWTIYASDDMTLEEYLQSYLHGEVDFYGDGLQKADIPEQVSEDEIILRVIMNNTGYIMLNPSLPPLDDRRVRLAIAQAINTDELDRPIDAFRANGGVLPLGFPGFTEGIGYRFSPDAAKLTLRDAGYSDTKPMETLVIRVHNETMKLALAIQKNLDEILGLSVEMSEYSDIVHEGFKGSWHIAVAGWAADFPDPYTFLETPAVSERYPNRHIIARIINEAACTQDPKRRLELYRKADALIVQEDVCFIPFAYGVKYYDLAKPWVKRCPLRKSGYLQVEEIIMEDRP